MSRTVPSFAEEGLKRFLHGMDRRLRDVERRGDWKFDDGLDPDELVITGSAPQLLCMSATGDSIASGGDVVAFDSLVASHGSFSAAAASSWVHPIGGVYMVTYDHAWDSYTGGGTIRVEIDGAAIPEGLIADSSTGQEGSKTISYVATAGSVGRIKVTQSSGSAQTCNATIWVSLPDPSGAEATGWQVRHFANSDFSTADLTHPATLEIITPAGPTISMPDDARWPGSEVVALGAIDFSSEPVLEHTGKGGATVLSTSSACIVTAHTGNPTNFDSQHQAISEVTGPGWVYRWEVTEAADSPSADFNDVYTYVWYAS